MILVFGGTTEGKQVITLLENLGLPYIYSTKTQIEPALGRFGQYRFGAFSPKSLAAYISQQSITTIIHASHPFAQVLHQTIAIVANQLMIPVYRLERQYPLQTIGLNVHYVSDYEDAIAVLNAKFDSKIVLALTGVQSIARFTTVWKQQLCYFRILDRQLSIDLAAKSDFPTHQLILGYPNDCIKAEIKLYTEKNIQVIITKESGDSGALSIKIEAALALGIAIIIIKKPALPASFLIVENQEALKNSLTINSLIS